MLFHVHMEWISNPSLITITPEQGKYFLENIVIPSLEMLAKDKRITGGGAFAGSRSVVFIVEENSADDLNEHLQVLPVWAFMHKTITPLQSFGTRAQHDRKLGSQIVALVGAKP